MIRNEKKIQNNTTGAFYWGCYYYDTVLLLFSILRDILLRHMWLRNLEVFSHQMYGNEMVMYRLLVSQLSVTLFRSRRLPECFADNKAARLTLWEYSVLYDVILFYTYLYVALNLLNLPENHFYWYLFKFPSNMMYIRWMYIFQMFVWLCKSALNGTNFTGSNSLGTWEN